MRSDSPRIRLSILGVVALSLFATLFARLWFLQVVGSPEYQLAAEVQRTREISIEAPRGRILDAKGRTIVDNRTSIVVTVDPRELGEIDDREGVLLRLAEELTLAGHPTKVAAIEERLVDPRYSPIEPVPVATDISEDLEVFLIERAGDFPAVDVVRESVRTYPYGQAAAHVLGYVGRISPEELVERMGTPEEPIPNPKPYQPDDNIGKEGVERIYEDDLRGTPGVKTVEVDARGEIIRTISYTPPVPGNDIQLTIDLDVQVLTEQALLASMAAARDRPTREGPATESPAGSAVLVDPNNGAVIALASYPTYSPEEFVGGISSERYNELREAGDPFTNRAIAGQYAPGSTFKLVTAYAGLSTGMITPSSSYADGGVYTAQGCSGSSCQFTNAGSVALGGVDIRRALTKSSDVFFYWLGDKFWVEREVYGEEGLQEAARSFGYGAETGIPLPFEQAGVVPTPAQRRQLHEENPEAFPYPEWRSGDNIITAIGQGDMLATPLQIANSYAAFANQGTLYAPNLVSRVLAPASDPANAEVVRDVAPRITSEIPLPDEIFQPMLQGFDGVTKDGGTASGVFAGWDQSAWPVAGKTGTAQVNGKADTSLFVGFGPTTAPQYVMAVVVEEGGFGADTAAPVVRRVLAGLAGQDTLPTALTVEEAAAAPPPEISLSGGGGSE